MHAPPRLTPEIILRAYAEGLFPMAESRDDNALYWVSPELRGIFPLERLHVPKRLARTVRSGCFTVTADRNFAGVIAACAEAKSGREETWISHEVERLYIELHRRGHAHSIECWKDGLLVGGLYGLKLGGAFFGESMFSRARDASKVALIHLAARLRHGGFTLLDTQFLTAHLASLGAIEVPRDDYLRRLDAALRQPARWPRYCPASAGNSTFSSFAPLLGETALTGAVEASGDVESWPGKLVLQLITQTS